MSCPNTHPLSSADVPKTVRRNGPSGSAKRSTCSILKSNWKISRPSTAHSQNPTQTLTARTTSSSARLSSCGVNLPPWSRRGRAPSSTQTSLPGNKASSIHLVPRGYLRQGGTLSFKYTWKASAFGLIGGRCCIWGILSLWDTYIANWRFPGVFWMRAGICPSSWRGRNFQKLAFNTYLLNYNDLYTKLNRKLFNAIILLLCKRIWKSKSIIVRHYNTWKLKLTPTKPADRIALSQKLVGALVVGWV